MAFRWRLERETAVHTILARLGDAGDDPAQRDPLIAKAWTLGANAQDLHDETGLSGQELKEILTQQGADLDRSR